ncbi:expressed protein [Echinococcus multilocularis]|uniref:Expressed protein n=1 Tax=Echinococcus multilocularis TaxID=6211 RepID=A0A068Y9Y5_ECHMU|nr:expressed protein [Echinococcus multilocularis]
MICFVLHNISKGVTVVWRSENSLKTKEATIWAEYIYSAQKRWLDYWHGPKASSPSEAQEGKFKSPKVAPHQYRGINHHRITQPPSSFDRRPRRSHVSNSASAITV